MAEGEPNNDAPLSPEELHRLFVDDDERLAKRYSLLLESWLNKIDLSAIKVDEGFVTRLSEWEEKQSLDK